MYILSFQGKRHSRDMETITEMSFLSRIDSLPKIEDSRTPLVPPAKLEGTDALPDANTCQNSRQDQATLSVHETIEEQSEVSENSSPDNEKSTETNSVDADKIEINETSSERSVNKIEMSDDDIISEEDRNDVKIIPPVSNKYIKFEHNLAIKPVKESKTKVELELEFVEKRNSIENDEENTSETKELFGQTKTTNVVMRTKSTGKSTSSEEGDSTLRDPDLKIYAGEWMLKELLHSNHAHSRVRGQQSQRLEIES